jgi:hypothetical protein
VRFEGRFACVFEQLVGTSLFLGYLLPVPPLVTAARRHTTPPLAPAMHCSSPISSSSMMVGNKRASTSIPRKRARPRPHKRKVGDSIRGEPPLIRHMGVRGGIVRVRRRPLVAASGWRSAVSGDSHFFWRLRQDFCRADYYEG